MAATVAASLPLLKAIIIAVACSPEGSRAGEIVLTLKNDLTFDRKAEPVTCGVPLPRGFAARAEDLGLAGPDGNPSPVQVRVTETYGDGSPRWVLLDFQADLAAKGSSAYRLSRGSRPSPAKALSIRLGQRLSVKRPQKSIAFRMESRFAFPYDVVNEGPWRQGSTRSRSGPCPRKRGASYA